MPSITLELLRKRVEHNEGEIHSVEELALHQEKIEKLENLDKWCRKLKILLLQNNLISKIENVGRLKELEYLNLALNNIERIENLEGCESLKKLDLTLNFIGEITCVLNLRQNYFLESLYLTGNPCVDFPGYRQYVINALPQLKTLDGADITPTERLLARQSAKDIEGDIHDFEIEYQAKRLREKMDYKMSTAGEKSGEGGSDDGVDDIIDTDESEYWNRVTPNTPEIRKELSLHTLKLEEKSRNAKSSLSAKKKEKREVSLFFPDGRPRNINEAKMSFSLHDEQDRNLILLDLAVPRHMCSSLIQADVQPTYVTCVVKGKIFQIVLPEEVKPDSSFAQRSKTTGHLLLTMPKLNQTTEMIWRGSSLMDDGIRKSNEKTCVIENAVKAGAGAGNNQGQGRVKNQGKVHRPDCPDDDDNGPKGCVDWRKIVPEPEPVPDPENDVKYSHSSISCISGDSVVVQDEDGDDEKNEGQKGQQRNSLKKDKQSDPGSGGRGSGENQNNLSNDFEDNPEVPPLL